MWPGCVPCSNLRLCSFFRLHEFDEQVAWVREGMAKVIPVPLLSLFTGYELETMVTALCFAIQCKLPNDTELMSNLSLFVVHKTLFASCVVVSVCFVHASEHVRFTCTFCCQACGSPDIPLTLLKSVATYKNVESTSDLIGWFWDVMDELSNEERSLFLRFVWGRTRLPRTIADFRGRDFVLQVRARVYVTCAQHGSGRFARALFFSTVKIVRRLSAPLSASRAP